MNLPLSAPLPTGGVMPTVGLGGTVQKTAADYPTKFEDIAPGSRILISGQGVQSPFEATVMDVMPEHGPTSIPALLVSAVETNEDFIITSSGLYVVTVLADARELAATMPTPKNAIAVRTIPHTGHAIQFKGGMESAREIVAWAIGQTTFRYTAATDTVSDHLTQSGVNGGIAWPGDWIVKTDGGQFAVLDDKRFATEYEPS